MEKTQPKPRGIDSVKDKERLVAGRYGTKEMCDIWGPEATYEGIMKVQVAGLEAINTLQPGRIPYEHLSTLRNTANLEVVNPNRIRELEEKGGHDVIAVNKAWEEKVRESCPDAAVWINFLRTSADSTETAKALQLRKSLEVYADSLENLRDIVLEKSLEWGFTPFMDQTHLLDALPTVAGRPLSFFAETMQSNLEIIAFVYANSLIAKWGDATGNHHAATAAGIDGTELQREYASALGLRYMDASAQVPSREYLTDVMHALVRSTGTVANLARYVRTGRGSDRGVFRYAKEGKKGSSAMPHKDLSGGNPDTEEQADSVFRTIAGYASALANTTVFDYGRDLTGSLLDRIAFDNSFKLADHVTRRMAEIIYGLQLNEERSHERIDRTYGITTAARVMTYLVDPSKTKTPLPRSEAHDLMARLATYAYDRKRPFAEILSESPEVRSRIERSTIDHLANPLKYTGESSDIVGKVYRALHGKKTFRG